MALKQVNPVEPASIKPKSVPSNATPSGYGPASLQAAYAFPSSTAKGCFRKVNQSGGTSYPTADTGWAASPAPRTRAWQPRSSSAMPQ
ncbi:MAG TPA: hypothetical protein VHO01_13395 [Jatrophihabitans sp.]|nr:hypothetical protein [Jatrophihabitans sp.]